MGGNEKTVRDLTETVFSFLSLKLKLIIIGVVLGLFLIIFIPVIAISAVTGGDDDETETSSVTSQEANATSEVIGSDQLYQYTGAKFAMPFETWDSSKDVVTSKFSKSRTITVNRCYKNIRTYSELTSL